MKCYEQIVSNTKDTCLRDCEGLYSVVLVDDTNKTLALNDDIHDNDDFKTFVTEYLLYKRGYETNFETLFRNISKSPKWPFLNEQAVQVEIGYDTNGYVAYRHEQRLELVKLYFSAATFEMITLDSRTDFVTKLSLIGGMLGLFTGFSFISLTEVIYFSLKRLIRFYQM